MNNNDLTDGAMLKRLEKAIELAQLAESPVFALCAEPSSPARLPTLFAGNDTPLVRTFNQPPSLRPHGFGLQHGGTSRIIEGELRRAVIAGWKILELWRDGTLIYAVEGTVQPCWASLQFGDTLRINPLALCEPVYLFAELSGLVYKEAIPQPGHITFGAYFKRMEYGGNVAKLSEGPLDPVYFKPDLLPAQTHDAPCADMGKAIVWNHMNIDPAAVAYQILQEIYHWFGISDDGIPYTTHSTDGAVIIDREALIRAGQQRSAHASPAPSNL